MCKDVNFPLDPNNCFPSWKPHPENYLAIQMNGTVSSPRGVQVNWTTSVFLWLSHKSAQQLRKRASNKLPSIPLVSHLLVFSWDFVLVREKKPQREWVGILLGLLTLLRAEYFRKYWFTALLIWWSWVRPRVRKTDTGNPELIQWLGKYLLWNLDFV